MFEYLDGYPPSAFRFTVTFGLLPPILDSSFQEVSGIGPQIDTEDVVDGGENRFVYALPKGVKHPKLVLKRGIALITSPLLFWCKSVFEDGLAEPITTKTLHVFLLNGLGLPLRCWSFENAWPVQWEIESFNSTKNEVAVEKIELSYAFSKRVV